MLRPSAFRLPIPSSKSVIFILPSRSRFLLTCIPHVMVGSLFTSEGGLEFSSHSFLQSHVFGCFSQSKIFEALCLGALALAASSLP